MMKSALFAFLCVNAVTALDEWGTLDEVVQQASDAICDPVKQYAGYYTLPPGDKHYFCGFRCVLWDGCVAFFIIMSFCVLLSRACVRSVGRSVVSAVRSSVAVLSLLSLLSLRRCWQSCLCVFPSFHRMLFSMGAYITFVFFGKYIMRK